MAVSDRSREDVAELLSALSGRYGSVAVDQTTTALPPAAYEEARKRFADGKVACAGVWIEDDEGRVLLVNDDDRTNRWAEPGGAIEADESLEAGAARWVEQTTGYRCRIDDVKRVSIVGIGDERNVDRPPVYQLQVLFSGALSGDKLELGERVAGVEWWQDPPATIADALPA
ncbi:MULTISPECIES: NUDIX hydrolase [unclassified Haladaptatus]|uniref:NUDIX hydrolase n=1 Tax=unclassified Haladaptatus TaxID=2622732 RepID=UPI0023E77917|nr:MULTISPECIES: NUDIX hydrolase [unclassified Haladaptatus]